MNDTLLDHSLIEECRISYNHCCAEQSAILCKLRKQYLKMKKIYEDTIYKFLKSQDDKHVFEDNEFAIHREGGTWYKKLSNGFSITTMRNGETFCLRSDIVRFSKDCFYQLWCLIDCRNLKIVHLRLNESDIYDHRHCRIHPYKGKNGVVLDNSIENVCQFLNGAISENDICDFANAFDIAVRQMELEEKIFRKAMNGFFV